MDLMGRCVTWTRNLGHDLFTQSDNQTFCVLRVFGIPFALVSSLIYFALTLYTVLKLRQPLDYVAFGGGLTAIWGVVAAAIIGQTHVTRGND